MCGRYLGFSKQREVGEIYINFYQGGAVDRREKGGAREREKKNSRLSYPLPACPRLPTSNMTARQTIASL